MKYRYIILAMILTISSGLSSAYFVLEDEKDFCIWGVSCEEGTSIDETFLNFSGYEGEVEGIVENNYPYNKSFFILRC